MIETRRPFHDLFYLLTCNICNFADDTTPYVCNSSLEYVLEKLEEYSALAMEWFEIHEMKMNVEKCHLFVSGNKLQQVWVRIRDDMIWKNRIVKLLGITIINELKLDEYLTNIWIKANRKLTVLRRMKKIFGFLLWDFCLSPFLNSNSNIVLSLECFIEEKTNNGINRLHERALSFVYSDYESTFEDLFKRN